MELLTVLAIIAILAAITVPAITSMQSSVGLDSTGQALVGQLNLARQYSLASDRVVQVRFYKLPDARNPAVTVYRGMQSFVENDTTSITPIGRPYFFPSPIVITQTTSNGTDVSSLLTPATSGIVAVNSGDPANPLPPPYGTSYTYEYFHFRPNGATDLSTTSSVNSTLTLVQETSPVTASGLPTNYLTLQINAVTGTVGMYRP